MVSLIFLFKPKSNSFTIVVSINFSRTLSWRHHTGPSFRTRNNDWPWRTTDHNMTLHHFDLRGRVRVQLLTYVDMSGWKVSNVLLSANTLLDMFAVNKDVSVRIFWHTSPWLCAVSSIISHWFTQCDVSLHNCINCETWWRASFHYKDAPLH